MEPEPTLDFHIFLARTVNRSPLKTVHFPARATYADVLCLLNWNDERAKGGQLYDMKGLIYPDLRSTLKELYVVMKKAFAIYGQETTDGRWLRLVW